RERDHAEVLRSHTLAELGQQPLRRRNKDTVHLGRVSVQVLKWDLAEAVNGDDGLARNVVGLKECQERQPPARGRADARFQRRRRTRRAHESIAAFPHSRGSRATISNQSCYSKTFVPSNASQELL